MERIEKIIELVAESSVQVYIFLKRLGYSEQIVKSLKRKMGQIEVGGEAVNVRHRLKKGDAIRLTFLSDIHNDVPPADLPLNIVYEDEDILIIDKQPGLAVMPTKAHYSKSLYSALKARYGEDFPLHVVTRLDRDTSGLMLIAKNSLAHSVLNVSLKDNVKREYLCMVSGKLEGSGCIDAPIKRAESGMRRIADEDGKTALTEYDVVKNFEDSTVKNFEDSTLVRVRLKTGRTHQIRVHFAGIGHPLLGDSLYADGKGFERQALHSCRLEFKHPFSGETLCFESANPDFLN